MMQENENSFSPEVSQKVSEWVAKKAENLFSQLVLSARDELKEYPAPASTAAVTAVVTMIMNGFVVSTAVNRKFSREQAENMLDSLYSSANDVGRQMIWDQIPPPRQEGVH